MRRGIAAEIAAMAGHAAAVALSAGVRALFALATGDFVTAGKLGVVAAKAASQAVVLGGMARAMMPSTPSVVTTDVGGNRGTFITTGAGTGIQTPATITRTSNGAVISGGGSGGRAAGSIYINVNLPGSNYSRQDVENLMDLFSEAVEDRDIRVVASHTQGGSNMVR